MKRHKGKCPTAERLKRQKSHVDDTKPDNENVQGNGRRQERANLQMKNEKAFTETQQDVASNILEDNVDGSQFEETATKKTHDEHQISTVENDQYGAAKKPSGENNLRERKSRPGFGFTKETGQYRAAAKSNKNLLQFQSRKNNKRCCEKKIHTDTKRKNIPDESCDLEMDVIYPRLPIERTLAYPPEQAPMDYADMSPKSLPAKPSITVLCMIPIGRKRPDEETAILIPHPKADRPEGDYFGANLSTYIDKNVRKYQRHFLVGDITGPAVAMKIRKNDELVLVNEVFVPILDHSQVLNIFHHVKVDGITRFSLVVRRVVDKEWQYIQTSAVLAPDMLPEKGPVIKRVKSEVLHEEAGKIEIPKSRHLYKVPGTQKYLAITGINVQIDVLKGDDTDRDKIVWKRCMVWPSGHGFRMDYAAALCDPSMTRYIGMDQTIGCIILKNGPEWFKYFATGSKVRFQLKDQYLGYNRENGEVKAQSTDCVFEELPASAFEESNIRPTSLMFPSVGIDQVDTACADPTFSEAASCFQDMGVDISNEEPGCFHGDAELGPSCPPDAMGEMNDGNDSPGNSSTKSCDLSSSQSSNYSDRSVNMYGNVSMETSYSSGYESLSQSQPNSFDFNEDDTVGKMNLEKHNVSKVKNQPKTPTTPMDKLSLV